MARRVVARTGLLGCGKARQARLVLARYGMAGLGAAGVENAERRKMKWCISTKCLTRK